MNRLAPLRMATAVSAHPHRMSCRVGSGSLGSVSLTVQRFDKGYVMSFRVDTEAACSRFQLPNRVSLAKSIRASHCAIHASIGESLGSRGHGPRA